MTELSYLEFILLWGAGCSTVAAVLVWLVGDEEE